jgi:hypothetical protein
MLGIADCIAGHIRPCVPQAAKGQRIGNQIDAAMIFAPGEFRKRGSSIA